MRTLKSHELNEIRDIANQCFVEIKQAGKRFNFEHFCWAFGPALDANQVVLWVTDTINAFLLVNYAPDPFAGELTGYSISWFVKPEFRKTGIGNKLWREFFKEGERRGCLHYIFGHPKVINKDCNHGWFEKRGLGHVENLYRFDV